MKLKWRPMTEADHNVQVWTCDEVSERCLKKALWVGEEGSVVKAHRCADHVPRGAVLDSCRWHSCGAPAVTERTDIGGTTFPLCAAHEKQGERRHYWRPKV